jgi:hypothetical protein
MAAMDCPMRRSDGACINDEHERAAQYAHSDTANTSAS